MTAIVLEEALRYAYVLALLGAAERAAVLTFVGTVLLAVAWTAWRSIRRHRSSRAPEARRAIGVPAETLGTSRALG
jgi:hypothetical protein